MKPTSFAKQKWEGRKPQFYFWVFCLSAIEITRSEICTIFSVTKCDIKTRSLTFCELLSSAIRIVGLQELSLGPFCFVLWNALLYYNIIKRLRNDFCVFVVPGPTLHDALLRTTTVCFTVHATIIFQRTAVFLRTLFRYYFATVLSSANAVSNVPGLFCTFDAIVFGRNHFYSCAQRYSYSSAQPYFMVCSYECCLHDSYFAPFLSECYLACLLHSRSLFHSHTSLCNLHVVFPSLSSSMRDSLGLISLRYLHSTLLMGSPLAFLACGSCAPLSLTYSWGPRCLSLRVVTPIAFFRDNDMLLGLQLELHRSATQPSHTLLVRCGIFCPKVALIPWLYLQRSNTQLPHMRLVSYRISCPYQPVLFFAVLSSHLCLQNVAHWITLPE